MIFGVPIFLYLLPAIGLPVIFHLLMKRKSTPLVFPTFMFFMRADPQLHSRRQLREWLLLLMRILLILLVILLLSRPAIQLFGNLTGKVAVAIVIDNSGSMSAAKENQPTKLEIAKDGARALVKSLGAGSEAAIVLLVDDPVFDAADTMTSDKEKLLRAIDRIRPTQATGNVSAALTRAMRLLEETGKTMERGLAMQIFSDLQDSEWSVEKIEVPRIGVEIHPVIHRIPTEPRTTGNVSIESISMPTERAIPKHPVQINVVVRNHDEAPITIRVNHEAYHQGLATTPVTLAGRATETVSIVTTPDEPGLHWINLWIEGDGFAADNHAGIGFVCSSNRNVLFAGDRRSFALLPKAISPTGDGTLTALQPVYSEGDDLFSKIQTNNPALVVLTWDELSLYAAGERSDQLKQYVTNGGHLLVLPASGSSAATAAGPEWLGASQQEFQQTDRGAVINILDRKSRLWGVLRDEEGKTTLRRFQARRYVQLALSPEYHVLLGLSFPKPVMAYREFGKGQLYVSGLAFDPRWASLASDPSGAAMILSHNMAMQDGNETTDAVISLVAGQKIPPVTTSAEQVEIISLVGDALALTVPSKALPAFPLAGVYKMTTPERDYYIQVRASDKEGSERYVEAEQLNLPAAFKPIVASLSEKQVLSALKGERSGLSLYLPLLLLALLVWGIESWLSSSTGRTTQSPRHAKKKAEVSL